MNRNSVWRTIYLLASLCLSSTLVIAKDIAPEYSTTETPVHADKKQVSVFVLHSYSQEYPWTRGQHQGFMEALTADHAHAYDVRVEYLDTKRIHYSPVYAEVIAGYLKSKYTGYSPDAIYVTDDNALSFALAHAEAIFPGVPIFFSGINNYAVRTQLDHNRITGVFENKEIVPNLRLMREIATGGQGIVVVGDDSETGRAIDVEVRAALAEQPGLHATFISSNNLDSLIGQIKKSRARFMFLTTLGAVANSNGRTLTLPETISAIAKAGNFIIISMEDAYLQTGVIGGWVTSGPRQGRAAAELLRYHLEGKPLTALPPIETSPNEYIFNDRELKHLGITLPQNIDRRATHINIQSGFYESNRSLVLGSLYAMLVLVVLCLIGVLILYVRKNRMILATSQRLTESEDRFRALFESSPDPVWIIEGHHFVECNQAAVTMLAYPDKKSLLNTHPSELSPEFQPDGEASFSKAERLMDIALASGINRFEWVHKRADGSNFYAEVTLSTIFIQGRQVIYCIWRDISERKHTEGKLQLAASVFTHAREGIAITDAEGKIVDVNNTFTDITGYGREEILGQNPRILKSDRHPKEFFDAMWKSLVEKGHWTGEIWNRRKNGEVYAEILTISTVRGASGKIEHYVSLFTDITPMKQHQQQLEQLAHYDTLTKLPNRVMLADRLQLAISQSQRRETLLAVLYLDVDGFKAVNDKHGHKVGDELLVVVSQRLSTALRSGDTLARVGGDEFVAVLIDLEQPYHCEPVLERLLHAASDPMFVGDEEFNVSVSIGVTIYPKDGGDADLLLRHADQAMYAAKQAGKNRFHLFDVVQDAATQTMRKSLEDIRRAINQREFVLHFQPKLNMKTGEVTGAEALIRWQHPERGLLAPGTFLHVIENHPISVELGEWVIDSALCQLSEWNAAGLDMPVSVNVSALQLQQEDFVVRLSKLLGAHPDVQHYQLELEILETSALEDTTKISEIMNACLELGVSFALDDFGTGYSSLTYLKHLPAELLKIDRSFVIDMLHDPNDLAIVKSVIGLSAAFHRQVIAEGVETEEHVMLLLSLGCELAQGYFIARPMPAIEFQNWMVAWQPDSEWMKLKGS